MMLGRVNAYSKIMTIAFPTPEMFMMIATMAKMIHRSAMTGTTLAENFATAFSPLNRMIAATAAMMTAKT